MKFLIFLLLPIVLFANIGKILALQGTVNIVRNGMPIVAFNGIDLEEKDVIKSGPKAQAQIVLTDKTTITIGKNSTFKIEEYFYDKTEQSKLSMKFDNGIFQTVTGKIGKINKNRFKLKTKSTSISIRGTTIVMLLTPTGETIGVLHGEIGISLLSSLVNMKSNQEQNSETIVPTNHMVKHAVGNGSTILKVTVLDSSLFEILSFISQNPSKAVKKSINKVSSQDPYTSFGFFEDANFQPYFFVLNDVMHSQEFQSSVQSSPVDMTNIYLTGGNQYIAYTVNSVDNVAVFDPFGAGTPYLNSSISFLFDFVNNTHTGSFTISDDSPATDTWSGNFQGTVNETGFTVDTLSGTRTGGENVILSTSFPSEGTFFDSSKESFTGTLDLEGQTSGDELINTYIGAQTTP